MTNLLGIVAAGGYASRMGISEPKSMLTIEGITLLEYTLKGLQRAGVKSIIVFTDRNDYLEQQCNISHKYDGVQVVEDRGVSSTIEMLYMARKINRYRKYVFCYGHAPRTSIIYKCLVNCERDLGGLVVNTSLRSDLIKRGNGFLEPPFFVRENKINSLNYCRIWSNLFHSCANNIYSIPASSPPEFNDQIGWYYYKRYMLEYITEHPRPKHAFNADCLLHYGLQTAG